MSAGRDNRKGSVGYSRGFVRMPRKAGRRRKKRGGASFFILLLVVLLIAGFLARRVMQPRTPRYVAPTGSGYPAGEPARGAPAGAIAQGRAPAGPAIAPRAGQNAPPNAGPANGENLTPEDHRALDDLIREKSR